MCLFWPYRQQAGSHKDLWRYINPCGSQPAGDGRDAVFNQSIKHQPRFLQVSTHRLVVRINP
jgi:hypothetical protein